MKESKIPKHLKDGNSVAFGAWVVFAPLLTASSVLTKITNAKNPPISGYVLLNKKKIYFCRYGMFDSESIFV